MVFRFMFSIIRNITQKVWGGQQQMCLNPRPYYRYCLPYRYSYKHTHSNEKMENDRHRVARRRFLEAGHLQEKKQLHYLAYYCTSDIDDHTSYPLYIGHRENGRTLNALRLETHKKRTPFDGFFSVVASPLCRGGALQLQIDLYIHKLGR